MFFRLGLEACIGDPSLFTGAPFSIVPMHNTTTLLQKHYKYVGYLMAMSIVQGGPGPTCLASWIFEYLAKGEHQYQD